MKDCSTVRNLLGRYKAVQLIMGALSRKAGSRIGLATATPAVVEEVYQRMKCDIFDPYREFVNLKIELLAQTPTAQRDAKIKEIDDKCSRLEEGFGMSPDEFIRSFEKVSALMEAT